MGEKDQYRHPSSVADENGHHHNGNNTNGGFVVSGAPWEAGNGNNNKDNHNSAKKGVVALDTANMDLFPTIITASVDGGEGMGQKASWGPRR